MAGLLHDLWAYKSGSYDDHAHLGADYARKVLGKMEITTSDETDIICDAIWHHDDKANVDSTFAEILKDADVIDHCLTDPTKEIKENVTNIQINRIKTTDNISYINNVQIESENEENNVIEQKEIYTFESENIIEIKNSETKVELSIDNSSWTNNVQNEIQFNYDNGEGGVDNFVAWIKDRQKTKIPVEICFVLKYPRYFQFNSHKRTIIQNMNGLRESIKQLKK